MLRADYEPTGRTGGRACRLGGDLSAAELGSFSGGQGLAAGAGGGSIRRGWGPGIAGPGIAGQFSLI